METPRFEGISEIEIEISLHWFYFAVAMCKRIIARQLLFIWQLEWSQVFEMSQYNEA